MNEKSTCTCISQERCPLAIILYKKTHIFKQMSAQNHQISFHLPFYLTCNT